MNSTVIHPDNLGDIQTPDTPYKGVVRSVRMVHVRFVQKMSGNCLVNVRTPSETAAIIDVSPVEARENSQNPCLGNRDVVGAPEVQHGITTLTTSAREYSSGVLDGARIDGRVA